MFDPAPLPVDLDEAQRTALAAEGITSPNAVQQAAWPPIAAGDPVVLHAGTGTGKTLAYLLPLVHHLVAEPDHRAVVVAPGTELVMQIRRVARLVAPDSVPVAAAATTTSRRRQKKRVVNSTRLILGTPDRIGDLFTRRKLKRVRMLVLDELDPLLASPASAFLEDWLVRSEPPLQVVVASATLGRRSEAFLARFIPDAVRVQPGAQPLVAAITHRLVRVRGTARDVALARFVRSKKVRHAIVFAADARQLSHLRRTLEAHGIPSVTVHRKGSKGARQRGLDAFRRGDARLLLTTDAIARGLDVPEVDWVLHHDLPRVPEAYVHRAGRTGRAGRRGTSVVFADDAMLGAVRRLSRTLGLDFATR